MKWTMKLVAAIMLFMFAACKKKEENPLPVIIRANGDITAKLEEFRNLLGNLNTTTGAVGGRREINWDAVPDSLLGKKLPADFFNPLGDASLAPRQRGLSYPDNGLFMVSKTNFSEVNSSASSEFAAFSGNKVFANTEASLWGVTFEVPGQHVAASIKGFGAVFTDVDNSNSTFIEFFSGSNSLGKFYVPAQTNGSKFSFLGIYFREKNITSIKIGHEGKLSDGAKDISQGGKDDLIVIDDFIYSEPVSK